MKIENKNVRRNFFWGDGRFYTRNLPLHWRMV